MFHAAKFINLKIWRQLGWIVIVFAILIWVLRMVVPMIDLSDHRADIEQVVEEKAGLPLRIGSIQARLKGTHLVLQINHVSALDKETGEPRLTVPKVFIKVKIFQSLLTGQLQLGGGTLVGTKLKLERHLDGTFTLYGFDRDFERQSSVITELFLGQEHLRMHNTEILLTSTIPGRPSLHLSGVEMDLLNNGLRHQLTISSRIGVRGRERIYLMADLHQPSQDSLALEGHFYLKCEDLTLGGQLREWLPEGYRVDRAQLQLEVWGALAGGMPQRLSGEVTLKDLQINGFNDSPPFQLSRLSTRFNWKKGTSGWWLAFDEFSLQGQDTLWPPSHFTMTWLQNASQETALRLQADYLFLDVISDFMAILKIPDADWHKDLLSLAPQGEMSALDFTLRRSWKHSDKWTLKGEIKQYAQQTWGEIPGVRGVDLTFNGNQSEGWLKIRSDALSIDYQQLFLNPLLADHVKGDFKWRFDKDEGLRLQSDLLELSNPDLRTHSRIDVQIPMAGKDTLVDIQTDFWDSNNTTKRDYLPVKVMPRTLTDWIEHAFIDGRITSGSFLLHGPIEKFPFKQQEGRFEIWFGLEDVILDYQPEWPELSKALAEVHFINDALEVNIMEGRMLASQLEDVSVKIADFLTPSPVQIQGKVKGPFKDLIAILADTPLREDFAPLVSEVSVSGDTRMDLDMAIPLTEESDQLKVNGLVGFSKAALKVQEVGLELQELAGKLRFDLSGIQGEGISAKLMGQKVFFDVSPDHYQSYDWTQIVAQVPLDMARLEKQFPQWDLHNFKGVGQADITFRIAHQPSRVPVRMKLRSNLQGISILLPDPLGKQAESTRMLDLGVDFRDDSSTELRIRYGEQTQALWRFFDNPYKPWVAAIGFGQQPLSLDGIEGFYLIGSLEKLNADEWIAWVGKQSSQGQASLPRIEMNLRVGELTALGTACPLTHFSYKNYADGYRVSLTSETVQGSLQVPRDFTHQPILGRFDYLKLNLRELANAITGEHTHQGQEADLDPRDVPAVNFSVEQLYINNQPMGKGNLSWSKEKDGITIDHLVLVGKSIDILGQGYWRLTPKGHASALNLQMKTPSLGELQQDMGLTTGIEQAPAEVKAELYWPSSPLEVGAEKLYGSLWLKVGKGQVKNVEPGMGRLIGLFSLNALGKRLALDFSDLFSQGMAFDTIEGNFMLNDGDAYTTDLAMKTTSAVVEIRGRTGLSSRVYDQRVAVTPNVSATLPLVGALTISPSVGVALALTQQLIGEHVDRIAMRIYEISGSWDHPQIKQIAPDPEAQKRNIHMPEMPGAGM
jgi:uncharacterized protein (TIGR02099 family)